MGQGFFWKWNHVEYLRLCGLVLRDVDVVDMEVTFVQIVIVSDISII